MKPLNLSKIIEAFGGLFAKSPTLKISKSDVVNVSDSVDLFVKHRSGNTAGIRHADDDKEHAADYDGNTLSEKSIIKSGRQQMGVEQKKEGEIEVVNKFLQTFNNLNGTHFVLSAEQPPEDSDIDVLLTDRNSRSTLGLQVTVSDDSPWKELNTTKAFQRSGDGLQIHHDAIKRAIEDKIKYPVSLRRDMMLLLDGWLGVRPEDLIYFRDTEKEFMAGTGFKEIWFVGGLTETVVKLHPSIHYANGG